MVCKSKDNGKLLFIRRNIQYFVSTAILNVTFKAKGNGGDQDFRSINRILNSLLPFLEIASTSLRSEYVTYAGVSIKN